MLTRSNSADPVILIEINEVPNEVLDAYARLRSGFMKDLLAKSDRYTTITPDVIQLDPWIAWPTFHRGVNDATHNLLRLGQDTRPIDDAYAPVWRLLSDAGVPVGVYGSLFSSSEDKLDDYEFFVPDVFSPHDRVKPESLSRFQNFNLAMTRASARNADDKVASGGGRAMAELALSGQLQLGTMARIAKQLVSEKLDKKRVSRRRNVQTELHADVFAELLKKTKPAFSTFYTNNVAAAMHRFWSASVPSANINVDRLSKEWIEAYGDEVFSALYSVERLLARLTSGEFGPVTLVIASALGQEEIPAENYASFLTIKDIGAFVGGILGDPSVIERMTSVPTMVPDFSVRFEDPADATALLRRLDRFEVGGHVAVETLERMQAKELVDADGITHIRHDYGDDTHFKHAITYKQSDAHNVHISVQIDDYEGPREARVGNESFAFDALGLGFVSHDEGVNCTAQHCAEGSLAVYRVGGEQRGGGVQRVSTLDFAPSLLRRFSVAVPDYMPGNATIAL